MLTGEPLIHARSLTKRYGGQPVVDGITFQVMPGECFGLLGPNGAGKSTTLRMIIGMTPVDDGQLFLFGQAMAPEQQEIKAAMGVVFQEDNLDDDLTVAENLWIQARYYGVAKSAARLRVPALLAFAQLTERSGDTVRHLSGGMRRRLVLARALVANPRLVILDEPTTGLDPQARHVIWQRLRTLREGGVTLLLTSHNMEEAQRLCDRVLILDHGRILDLDTPANLVARHVEPEVVELRSSQGGVPPTLAEPLPGRLEVVESALYCYTHDPVTVMERLCSQSGLEVLRRPTNLEDVFLRLTGRELRE